MDAGLRLVLVASVALAVSLESDVAVHIFVVHIAVVYHDHADLRVVDHTADAGHGHACVVRLGP